MTDNFENIGFDNEKYLQEQTEAILKRVSKFNDKLYLEFGGKILYDYHASRVLPGFAYNVKMRLLQKMKDQGIKLGRKKGSTVKLNQMKRRKDSIIKDLKKGMSLNNIYEKYKVSRTTINKLREIDPEINDVLKKREKSKS